MSFLGLVWRSLVARRLSSWLTALSVALGVALVVSVLLARQALEDRFVGPARGYSTVVGAPGSPLELVLNAVFHLGESPGLMPMKAFDELRAHESTRVAVPYAVGDSFRGFPVVGTTPAFFDERLPHPPLAVGRPFAYSEAALKEALAQMRAGAHAHGDEATREAVVGAEVARRLGVRVGDRIEPTHGTEGEGAAHAHEHLWTVVGVLEEAGAAVDRVVLINLDSFYRIADHAGGLLPGGEPGLSGVLLWPRGGVHKALLLGQLRNRPDIQVADVGAEVDRLLGLVGRVDTLLLLVAILVCALGLLSVAVAIYNTMEARGRDIAVLRALGARRRFVTAAVMAEATIVAALGAALGLVLGHLLIWALGGWIEAAAGFAPQAERVLPEELLVAAGVVVAGALAGLLPAARAYRSDVATGLRPQR